MKTRRKIVEWVCLLKTFLLAKCIADKVRGKIQKQPSKTSCAGKKHSSHVPPYVNVGPLYECLGVRKKEPFLLNFRTHAHSINVDLGGAGGRRFLTIIWQMAVFKSRPGKGMCLFMLFIGTCCIYIAHMSNTMQMDVVLYAVSRLDFTTPCAPSRCSLARGLRPRRSWLVAKIHSVTCVCSSTMQYMLSTSELYNLAQHRTRCKFIRRVYSLIRTCIELV